MQSDLFHCKVTLHISGVTAPINRVLKTVTAASGTGHNISTATSLQHGHIPICIMLHLVRLLFNVN